MGFLYYFLGSVVLGIIPAIVAVRAKRNFFLWWLYGALLFPAALLHSILLILKAHKGMVIVYSLVIVYGIGIFYFATWFLSTQPISMKQAEVSEAKYKIAELILENSDTILSGQVSDFKSFISERTKLRQPDIDATLEDMSDDALQDQTRLKEFALELLRSLNKIYLYISDKGAFEEFSVPMGAAANVFIYYIDSLALLNKYEGKDVSNIEANLESMLSTEQMYFKTTKNAKPFIEHLDVEAQKENPQERMSTIIDHYLTIGKILTLNGQRKDAMRCYDNAIALYNKILMASNLSAKERASYIYRIAEAYDKKADEVQILAVFNSYLDHLFRAQLYTDKDTPDDVQKFVKLHTIMNKHENLARILQTFMALAEANSSKAPKNIANMANLVLTPPEIFLKLSGSERSSYSRAIDANFKIIIDENDITSLPMIQKAFTFFEDNMYGDLAKYYMDTAVQLYKDLLTIEDKVIDDYNALSERVAVEQERVLAVIEDPKAVPQKERTAIMFTRSSIDSEMKRIEAINVDIKEGRQVIAAIIDPKASQDRTFRVESGTRDAVREYIEIVTTFETALNE